MARIKKGKQCPNCNKFTYRPHEKARVTNEIVNKLPFICTNCGFERDETTFVIKAELLE